MTGIFGASRIIVFANCEYIAGAALVICTDPLVRYQTDFAMSSGCMKAVFPRIVVHLSISPDLKCPSAFPPQARSLVPSKNKMVHPNTVAAPSPSVGIFHRLKSSKEIPKFLTN